MKSIEFDESGLADLDSLAKQLFESENDPSSSSYKRVLVRPKIKWFSAALFLVLPLAVLFFGAWISVKNGVSSSVVIWSGLGIYFFYLILNIKRITVFLIKVYQRYAPDSVRNQCRFEPSCSVYMIMAIEKYGYIKGARKGIDRLRRCNINNGGYDYP